MLARAELIVHAGDFVAASVLAELELLGPVAAVHGNMDDAVLREQLPERAVSDAAGIRIGLVHDAGRRDGRAERLRSWFPDCDVVVYGHTHVPDVLRHDGAWIVNPGSPTERRQAPARTMAFVAGGRPRVLELR